MPTPVISIQQEDHRAAGEQFAGNAAPNSYAYGAHEGGGGAYCDPSADYGNVFYSRDAGYEAQWNQANALQEAALSGSYYPTVPSSLQPQLYGAPISALAYDDEYEAIYVTSHTQPLGKYAAGKRASMMVTHSSTDGMLYSSCAAHPEASQSTLNTVYDTFYLGSRPVQQRLGGITRVPPHALSTVWSRQLDNWKCIFEISVGSYVPNAHKGIRGICLAIGCASSYAGWIVR